MTKECIIRKEKMPLDEFMSHCVASGGNWTAMIMSGIRDLSKEDCTFKKVFDEMPDKTYEFDEVLHYIEPYVDLSSAKYTKEEKQQRELRRLKRK